MTEKASNLCLFLPAHLCRFSAVYVRLACQTEDILTPQFSDWFSIFFYSSLLICDRLHYTHVISRNCNLFAPPPQPNRVDNAVKEFTKNAKRSKGAIQSSSLAFLIFFHHFLLKFVTFDMLRVSIDVFLFFSVCGNSSVCIAKADETVQKSSLTTIKCACLH